MSADVFKLLTLAENDFRAGMAKLTQVRAHLAAMNLVDPSRARCECGLSFAGPNRLAEHRYYAHDGPEPEHWLVAERRSL